MEHNDFDRLGGIIKAARKAKGLTREQLSEIPRIPEVWLLHSYPLRFWEYAVMRRWQGNTRIIPCPLNHSRSLVLQL